MFMPSPVCQSALLQMNAPNRTKKGSRSWQLKFLQINRWNILLGWSMRQAGGSLMSHFDNVNLNNRRWLTMWRGSACSLVLFGLVLVITGLGWNRHFCQYGSGLWGRLWWRWRRHEQWSISSRNLYIEVSPSEKKGTGSPFCTVEMTRLTVWCVHTSVWSELYSLCLVYVCVCFCKSEWVCERDWTRRGDWSELPEVQPRKGLLYTEGDC